MSGCGPLRAAPLFLTMVGGCETVIGNLNDGSLSDEQQRLLFDFDDRCSKPVGHDGPHLFVGRNRAVVFDETSGEWEIRDRKGDG